CARMGTGLFAYW
nr:immunoglobulin heavy chain junction region [Mus musculus]